MKRWAVVFQNFGGPRVVRKTFTQWGAERVVTRLRHEAPVGAKQPSRHLRIEPTVDRRHNAVPWPPETERRGERPKATAGHGEMLAVRA